MLGTTHPKVQQRIAERHVAVHLVDETGIRRGLRCLFTTHGLAVEPSSAITIPVVKEQLGKLEAPICAILTGENIAREDFFRLVQEE